MRPWLALRSLEELNRAAAERDIRTLSGHRVEFVRPGAERRPYELQAYETGRIATRADNLHDWFNALAWLAFPRTKARMNAMHAAEIPRERGQRGPMRDLLTVFDEGGVLVACADGELIRLVRELRWKELFCTHRSRVRSAMRLVVLGHAALEKALEPWPGITCKALFVNPEGSLDDQAASWLAHLGPGARARDLAPLPVFGYPGWAENDRPAFYDDDRYFRQGKAG
ncbi:MAG TPA: DUF3025 domain-containing protein [Burkholderiales bacterium]|nr:DUF3025 domain-containing protein [Burkholderiales bacterium]